jgi:5-methylthioadenosine/S-adenosylhomocysteine deaminase
VLGETIIDFPVADAKTPAAGLARAETYIKAFQNDPLITPAVAPHAPYTVGMANLKAARALSVKYKVPTLIHVSETQQEEADSKKAHGARSVVAYLDSFGFLGPGVVAAHGVWVDAADIAILKARGVGIAHNPESNMKLASGIAPVGAYLAANVAIGLGTDGAASNNDLDMFEAMRQAALLAKVATRDPTAVPAQTALDMATIGGARALAMDQTIGSLERGKRADLIIVSMSSARQTPMYDAVSHLVYVTRGDDVRTTIVNGKVLMQNRQVRTLNRNEVIAQAKTLAQKVRDAVQ